MWLLHQEGHFLRTVIGFSTLPRKPVGAHARMGGYSSIALCAPGNTHNRLSPTGKSGAQRTSALKFHMALKSKALNSVLPGEQPGGR